jgi:hypothetical protein
MPAVNHSMESETREALARLRGEAPLARPSVRRLAAFANVHSCRTAAVAFATGIDTNRALSGMKDAMPFGQSRFAIGRGAAFEALLRRGDHTALRRVLTEGLGIDFSEAVIDDLRRGFPRNRTGMAPRAEATLRRMAEIVSAPDGQIVLDGAVLKAEVGGQPAYFEADEMAIGSEGRILVGENKSWPIVDGRPTDEDALGAALDQAATYILLGRRTLEQAGEDPSALSDEAVLITPRNTGLTPVLHKQSVKARIGRVERLLDAVPDVAELASSVPSTVTFDRVSDKQLSPEVRTDAFTEVAHMLGTVYRPGSCLASCGFARLCRKRAFAVGDPAIAGEAVAHALPGTGGLRRVAELARGAAPTDAERPAAEVVARAARLYDEATIAPVVALRRSA